MIGDVLLECELEPGERRRWPASRTTPAGRILDEGAEPLGRVVAGFGNDGESGYEGCRAGRVVGRTCTARSSRAIPGSPTGCWPRRSRTRPARRRRSSRSTTEPRCGARRSAGRARTRAAAASSCPRARATSSSGQLSSAASHVAIRSGAVDRRDATSSSSWLPRDAVPAPPSIAPRAEPRRDRRSVLPSVHGGQGAHSAPRYTPGRPGASAAGSAGSAGGARPRRARRGEEPVAADGRVLRGRGLERAPRQVAGEDDVHDVLAAKLAPARSSRRSRSGPRQAGRRRCRPPRGARGGARRPGSRPITPPPGSSQYSSPGLLVPAEEQRGPCQRRIAETRMRGSAAISVADEPKPRTPRSLSGSSSTSTSSTLRKREDHELRDPHARLDGERLARVGVRGARPDLAAVAGVDQAGRVHERDPVPRRETGARLDEARMPFGNRNGQAGADRPPARPARAHRARRRRDRVRRLPRRRAREHRVRAQPLDRQLDHARSAAGACRGSATR